MMKNSKIIMFLSLSIIALAFSSCGDPDKTIFEGTPGDQVIVTFDLESISLPVVIDSTGSVEVQVNTTTTSPQDRTFDIEVLEGENKTTADPATYSVPATMTIPANKYIGTFTITGTDIGVETTPEIVTIQLSSTDPNIIVERNVSVVNIYQVCPIPSDFLVGEYQLEDVVGTLGGLFTTPGPNFKSAIVTVRIGETPTQRVFSASLLPAIGGATTEIVLDLVCGEFKLGEKANAGVFCSYSDPEETDRKSVV